MEEIFFQDETAPSKGKVTLREIRDVLNDAELPQEMSIHNWLNIWNHTGKLEKTTLHFFNDKLPQGSPLAYGIFVEEDEKRISVSIKGSNSEKTGRGNYFKDWTGKNAECDFDQWKYPDGGCIGLNHRCPWVHRGYTSKFSVQVCLFIPKKYEQCIPIKIITHISILVDFCRCGERKL